MYINDLQIEMIIMRDNANSSKINHMLRIVRQNRIHDELQTANQNWQMAIEAILSAQIDDPLTWKHAHLSIGKAGLAIGIVNDHPDTAYISSCLGTVGLVNKLLGRNDTDADPTDDLSAEFEHLHQCVNPGDLDALDKILKFNPKAPVANIQSKIMHLMNKAEYDRMFVDNNVRNKGHLLSLRASWRQGTSPPYCYPILASPCLRATSNVSSSSGWASRHAQPSVARSAVYT
jgi:hypothetical protein